MKPAILKKISDEGFRILSTGESAIVGSAAAELIKRIIDMVNSSGSGGYTIAGAFPESLN
jgi:hypothetical protein